MFKKLLKSVKDFIKDEEGYTVESLVWTLVVGLGASAIAFGLMDANRFQGGGIRDDMKAIELPAQIPTATEQVTEMQAGYSGAVTGVTITQ